MDQPSNMTVQQWLEFIRHAKDDQEIAAFAADFDQVYEAETLDDAARVDILLAAGEVLYEKARYKDAQRLLERGAEQAQKIVLERGTQFSGESPPPDQLDQVIAATHKKVFA